MRKEADVKRWQQVWLVSFHILNTSAPDMADMDALVDD
jgi:hypothetical protein